MEPRAWDKKKAKNGKKKKKRLISFAFDFFSWNFFSFIVKIPFIVINLRLFDFQVYSRMNCLFISCLDRILLIHAYLTKRLQTLMHFLKHEKSPYIWYLRSLSRDPFPNSSGTSKIYTILKRYLDKYFCKST